MEQTRQKSTYLLWAVWICAAILLATVGLLIYLEVQSARMAALEENAPPQTQPAVTEPEITEPVVTEPTLPILDLPENPYGPEDFGYRGRYLTCNAGSCMLGIDVSAWQEEINWTLVKAVGMDFAMIRLAWRGSSEGRIEADSCAVANYEGAKAAGVKVGGYFFSQAITPEEAVEEAEFLLEIIDGWEMDLPIVYDWEFAGGPRTDGMDARAITDCAKAFCQTIEAAGYDAMVYFNPHMAYYDIYLEELKEYDFWLAMWDADMVFPYQVDMWQYTDQGSVAGIEGNVDLDIYFIYEE